MAKILIIDDHLTMVDLIRAQLQEINSNLTTGDFFCFDYDEHRNLCIQAWTARHDTTYERRILFEADPENVFSAVYQFLHEHSDEAVVILIDLLLKSQNINAPSMETYTENKEFSCELYASLAKIKNGKPTEFAINSNNFFFLLYSRSDASNSVVFTMLSRQYNDDDAEYFPCECYLPENISWCKNRCEVTDENNLVVHDQNHSKHPLALPDGYDEFFAELL